MSMKDDQDNQDISLAAHDQYMRFVKWTPPITDEERAQLFQCLARGKAEQGKVSPDRQVLNDAKRARDRVVEGFQPLIIKIALPWLRRFTSMQLMDLVQEGNLGLLKAIDLHHYGGDHRLFMGLASRCISQAMWWAWQERDGMVRLSRDAREVAAHMKKVEGRLVAELGREPSVAEIAHAMGMSEAKLREWLGLLHRQDVISLEAVLEEEGAEETREFVSLYEAAVAAETGRQAGLQEAVQQALEHVVSPRHREVIRLHFGFDGECHSYQRIAHLLGMAHAGCASSADYYARPRLRRVLAPLLGLDEEEKAS